MDVESIKVKVIEMVIYSHCIDCGERLTKDEDMFCVKCIEAQSKNEKLQELIQKSVRVR